MGSTTPPSPGRPRKRPRPAPPAEAGPGSIRDGAACPYMDTIARSALDFDLPPICSISLQSHNVYICLAVYCLPDSYRVTDPSFADLASALRPTFSAPDLARLDDTPLRFRVLDGSLRLRGAVPLDNLSASDYANAVFQLVLRAPPVRHFLLTEYAAKDADALQPAAMANADAFGGELAPALASLCAKLWASHALRAHVAPHELMQLVARASKGRFGLLKQADPIDFTAWLLNSLSGRKGPSQSASPSPLSRLVESTFRGEMAVETFAADGGVKKSSSPFWFLPLDLPPKPLFKDASERTLVAQVPLSKLLAKFDGVSRHHVVKTSEQRTYKIARLPPYLLLVIRRFSKSKFGVQKNPCVVHLPAEGLDLTDICEGEKGRRYSLIAAVLHAGTPANGKYRIALQHDATKSWYDLSDMTVKPTLEQLVSLADTYILLYSRPSANDMSPS